MADKKLSELTELPESPADDDEVYIRDVSEVAAQESKRITVSNLVGITKDLFGANTILKADTNNTPVALAIAAQRIVGRITSGVIAALTGAQVLSILTGQATAAFNWNDQKLNNIKTLNISSAGTKLTISSGAVTVTRGHHKIDTESNASTDDLDTITGLDSNDLLLLFAADGDHTVRLRHGIGNIFLRHHNDTRSETFISPSGSSGTFYASGFYDFNTNEAVLTQGGTAVTYGIANHPYAAHASVIAKGDGAKSGGDLVLTVTGTSIDDEGNRSAADSEVIVASAITADFATDAYAETVKKWLGIVTFTLSSSGGSNFNCSFNYGFTKYEDLGNQAFTATLFECVGRAGANDSGFNIRLFHHNSADWTYAASGFVPGPTAGDTSELANMATTHSTESDLANGKNFAFKVVNLNTDIMGDNGEGFIVEITTTANKAVESMDMHLGVHTVPSFLYLAAATQHVLFMKHGSAFHQV